MSAEHEGGEPLYVGVRPIRDLSNALGQTFDIDAMRDLGIADENGNLKEDVQTRQKIYDDGRIVIEIED